MRPATDANLHQLRLAIKYLRMARFALQHADCPKTLRRVRLALTSAGGAERHMLHRIGRTHEGRAKSYRELVAAEATQS